MPDQGQLWATKFQIGRETVPGVAVPATRKAFFNADGVLTVQQAANEHRFAVGRRDNLLDITAGPIEAGGSVAMPMSAAEITELCLVSLQGGVTPTLLVGSTGVQTWRFKPSTTLDAMTVEWDDGANLWQGAGGRGNQFQITGDAGGTNMVSVDLFSNDVIVMPGGALTTGLADRVPDFLEGWQTRLFIGSFGLAFSALDLAPGLLRNWTITVANGLNRVRNANNTKSTARLASGELAVSGSVTFDAYGSRAINEFNRWRANNKMALGLEFVGPASGIEAGVNAVQNIAYGTQTGGTWIPSFMNIPGTPVPWNATAAQLQAALRSIDTIGATDVVVTGGPAPGTPHIVTFADRWAEYAVPLITADTTALTGGVKSVTVTSTTAGRSGRRRVTCLMPGKWTTANIGGSGDGIRTYEMGFSSIYDPTLAAMFELVLQNERTTAF